MLYSSMQKGLFTQTSHMRNKHRTLKILYELSTKYDRSGTLQAQCMLIADWKPLDETGHKLVQLGIG